MVKVLGSFLFLTIMRQFSQEGPVKVGKKGQSTIPVVIGRSCKGIEMLIPSLGKIIRQSVSSKKSYEIVQLMPGQKFCEVSKLKNRDVSKHLVDRVLRLNGVRNNLLNKVSGNESALSSDINKLFRKFKG